MHARRILVLVASAVLMGLLGWLGSKRWLGLDPVQPPDPATAHCGPGTTLANRPAADPASGGVPVDGAAVEPRLRREADAATIAAGRHVRLQGKWLGSDPPPAPEFVHLAANVGCIFYLPDLSVPGAYAFADLPPGPVHLRGEVEGCRRIDLEHVLDDRPVQQLDLMLRPAIEVRVFVRTPEGLRLPTQLAAAGSEHRLHVVVTRAPLYGDFEPTPDATVGDIGLARFRPSQPAGEAEHDGVLILDEDPPLHAALLLRHLLLAQQPIAPGQTELHFRLASAEVVARFGEVRLRVLGPDGSPCAGAQVGLNPVQGGGTDGTTGVDGSLVLRPVLPGLAGLEVVVPGAEQFSSHVLVPAGRVLDLGDVRLTAPVTIVGRIVDEAGAASPGTVAWTAIDDWQAPHPTIEWRTQVADAAGTFRLSGLGMRRYSLRVQTHDARVGFGIVDAGGASGEEPRIVVRPSRLVQFAARTPDGVRCVAVDDGSGGLLAVCRLEARWPNGALRLPPGDYQCTVYDGLGAVLSRSPLVVGSEDLRQVVP